MDETPTSSGRSEATSCEPSWWPPDFLEKIESVALAREQEVLAEKESRFNLSNSRSSSWKASQLLWSTGTYSGFIPNGFYSIIPDKKLKEISPTIPSLNDLQSLEADGLKPEIIVVDAEKDKNIFLLKQLSGALVKGLNSPALVIKKIAGLVFDCFKGQNPDASPGRASTEDTHFFGNRGPQLLGQIRHGSCRPRAILVDYSRRPACGQAGFHGGGNVMDWAMGTYAYALGWAGDGPWLVKQDKREQLSSARG